MSDKPAAAAAGAAPPKKSNMMVIIIAAVAVLGLGGGGGFFYLHSKNAAKAEAENAEEDGGHKPAKKKGKKKAAAEEEAGGIVALEPFIVNLADPTGSHYLRATLKLVVSDEKAAEKLSKNQVAVMRLRSAILELLSQQKANELVKPEGKSSLKKEISEHIEPLTGGVEVSDVLFSDFVVQF